MERAKRNALILLKWALLLGSSAALLLHIRQRWGVTSDALSIAVLILPLLVYVIASGELRSFKGPGDVEIQLAPVAFQPVHQRALVQQMTVVAKLTVEELRQRLPRIDDTRPVVMTMQLGQAGYDKDAMNSYLTILSSLRQFKFVVFLRATGTFVGYMSPWALKSLMAIPTLADAFLAAVQAHNEEEIKRFPSFVTDTLTDRSSNAEALRESMKRRLEALVVVGRDGRMLGVVERDSIITKMLLTSTLH